MYGPRMGLMLYVAEAVARRGAEVEVMEWAPPPEQSVERVAEQVEPVVAKQPAPPLLVASRSVRWPPGWRPTAGCRPCG